MHCVKFIFAVLLQTSARVKLQRNIVVLDDSECSFDVNKVKLLVYKDFYCVFSV